jgi:hypothetical protein
MGIETKRINLLEPSRFPTQAGLEKIKIRPSNPLWVLLWMMAFAQCTPSPESTFPEESKSQAMAQTSWMSPLKFISSAISSPKIYSISLSGATMGTAFWDSSQERVTAWEFRLVHRMGPTSLFSVLSSKIEGECDLQFKITSTDGTGFQWEDGWSSAPTATSGEAPKPGWYLGEWWKMFQTRSQLTSKDLPTHKPCSFPGGTQPKSFALINPFQGIPMEGEQAQPWLSFNASQGSENPLPLLLKGDFGFEISEHPPAQSREKMEKWIAQPTDPSFFSTQVSLNTDLDILQHTVEQALIFVEESEKVLKQKITHVPYLVIRKFVNFKRYAGRLEQVLTQASLPPQSLVNLGTAVDTVLNEDIRELPRSFSHSAELFLLADPTKAWMFPKILTKVILNAHTELSQILAIEQEQKRPIHLHFQLDKLVSGSIIKGVLVAKRMDHQFDFRVVDSPSKSPALLHQLLKPIPFAKGGAVPATLEKHDPIMLDGQLFARGNWQALGEHCKKFRGQVGLDLSDAEPALLFEGNVRGIWDTQNRLIVLREFLKKVSIYNNCKKILIKVNESLKFPANAELTSFQQDVFQTQREFQATNGSTLTLRTIPGIYEVVLTSLVNGQLLHRQQIEIEEGKVSARSGVGAPTKFLIH